MACVMIESASIACDSGDAEKGDELVESVMERLELLGESIYIFEGGGHYPDDINDFLLEFTLDPFREGFLAVDKLIELILAVDVDLVSEGKKLKWTKNVLESLKDGVKYCKEGTWEWGGGGGGGGC